jgi:hypothetical protein
MKVALFGAVARLGGISKHEATDRSLAVAAPHLAETDQTSQHLAGMVKMAERRAAGEKTGDASALLRALRQQAMVCRASRQH